MPAFLTDFADGSKAIAESQQAALQYHYAPQQADLKNESLRSDTAFKADQAIEKHMQVSALQESYSADKEISSKLAEIYNKDPNTEPADALTAIIPHLKGKAQLTAIEKLPAMQKQQAEAQSAKYARQQQRQDAMYSRVADIPPEELPSAILGMIQDKTMTPEEGTQATQIIAKVGPAEAQRIFRKQHTTDAMRKTEIAAKTEAEKERHNLATEEARNRQINVTLARIGAAVGNNDTKNAMSIRKETLQEVNGMVADRNALAKFFKENPKRPEPDKGLFSDTVKNQDAIDAWDDKEARLKTLDANIELGQEVLKQTNPLLTAADKAKEKAAAAPLPAKSAPKVDPNMPANVNSPEDWEAAKKDLLANPKTAAIFDKHFGAGAANKVLAGQRSVSGKIR
jgi:hypothetical protein